MFASLLKKERHIDWIKYEYALTFSKIPIVHHDYNRLLNILLEIIMKNGSKNQQTLNDDKYSFIALSFCSIPSFDLSSRSSTAFIS